LIILDLFYPQRLRMCATSLFFLFSSLYQLILSLSSLCRQISHIKYQDNEIISSIRGIQIRWLMLRKHIVSIEKLNSTLYSITVVTYLMFKLFFCFWVVKVVFGSSQCTQYSVINTELSCC